MVQDYCLADTRNLLDTALVNLIDSQVCEYKCTHCILSSACDAGGTNLIGCIAVPGIIGLCENTCNYAKRYEIDMYATGSFNPPSTDLQLVVNPNQRIDFKAVACVCNTCNNTTRECCMSNTIYVPFMSAGQIAGGSRNTPFAAKGRVTFTLNPNDCLYCLCMCATFNSCRCCDINTCEQACNKRFLTVTREITSAVDALVYYRDWVGAC